MEDEAIVAMDIRHRLQKLGYEPVRSLTTGEEAIELAPELGPDLVLMDIQLAGEIDGIRAAEVIRNRTGTPVVFLTAYSDRDSLERAKVADAFGYLLKPFEERDLGIAIEMALYKERMQRQLSESREWLRGTVAALHEGVITTEAAGTIRFMNRRAAELTGRDEEAAQGCHIDDVLRTETIPTAEYASGILPEAVRLLRPDGSVAYVERRVNDIRIGEEAACGRAVVLREVSDILSYERGLREAREEAERALKTRSEFLANVTHELRTPLNSILGMADLAHSLATDERQREYLGILRSSGENLLGLISSILDLSRVDAGHLELAREEVDLDQVLQSVVESFSLEAHRKGLVLHFAQDPATPAFVRGDRVRIVQVLSNLVANAVKYTESGSVTVSAGAPARGAAAEDLAADDPAADGVTLAVSDTGPGIPQRELERIFEPFTQVDGGSTRPHGGAGIGLAIARELTRLMGGHITVESTPGEGTTFSVALPLAAGETPRQWAPGRAEGRRVAFIGRPGATRDALERWADYAGATRYTLDPEEAVGTGALPPADLVVVLGEDGRADSIMEDLPELGAGARVLVSRPIAPGPAPDADGRDRGETYRAVSAPLTPAAFLEALTGIEPAARQDGRDEGAGGGHGTGAGTEPAPWQQRAGCLSMETERLLERFDSQRLEASRLAELAEVARTTRGTEGNDGHADEILFRISLTARRGDLAGARERLLELETLARECAAWTNEAE